MHEIFTSGRVVDLVLGVMALEAVALGAYHHFTGRGVAIFNLLANLASGVCLLLALRAALTGQPWTWVAAALSASLLGHLLDLSRRWRSPQRRAPRSEGARAERSESSYDRVDTPLN